MGMLRRCSVPGCETFTLGRMCLEHEEAQRRSVRIPAVADPRVSGAQAIATREGTA